jgi:hypothetical protein
MNTHQELSEQSAELGSASNSCRTIQKSLRASAVRPTVGMTIQRPIWRSSCHRDMPSDTHASSICRFQTSHAHHPAAFSRRHHIPAGYPSSDSPLACCSLTVVTGRSEATSCVTLITHETTIEISSLCSANRLLVSSSR